MYAEFRVVISQYSLRLYVPFLFSILFHAIPSFFLRNGTERLNDIHILDTATSTWTCSQAGGVLPHPRAGMTLTALRGRLYLFGGSGTSSKCFHDLQILDRQKMAWLDVTQYDPAAVPGHHNKRMLRGFDGEQQHHHHQQHHADTDDFARPQWRFGGQDGTGTNLNMVSSNLHPISVHPFRWQRDLPVSSPLLDYARF